MVHYWLLSFVVSPVTNFLNNPRREIALFLLFFFVFICNQKSDKNYFEHLKVTPHDSVDMIKKSFKNEAMLLHPDRNTSPTASADYISLANMYKTLVNDTKREAYTRYGDLIKGRKDKLVEMSPYDVLYVVTMNTASALFAMCVTMIVHGRNVLNLTLLLYELFCFALDVYLRLAPDSTTFMSGVPILKAYTVFELIAILRSFRIFFLHYSSIMHPKTDEVPWKTGSSLVRSNMAMIEHLDTYLVHVSRVLTSHIPVVNSEVAWRGVPSVAAEYEKVWEQAVAKASAASGFTHKALIEKVCGRKQTNNIRWLRWNGATLQRMLRQVDNLFENGIGYGTIAVYLVLGFFWFMM